MRAPQRPTSLRAADPYLRARRGAVEAWIAERSRGRSTARLDDASVPVDVAIAVGVLEREHDPRPLLDRLSRLVADGGEAIVVTPNRLTASPGRTRPRASGHAWEYTPSELQHLLRWRFSDVRIVGTFHGRRLRAIERLLGAPLGPTLDGIAPPDRAVWLRGALRRLGPSDFPIRSQRLTDALDLIACARA